MWLGGEIRSVGSVKWSLVSGPIALGDGEGERGCFVGLGQDNIVLKGIDVGSDSEIRALIGGKVGTSSGRIQGDIPLLCLCCNVDGGVSREGMAPGPWCGGGYWCSVVRI